MYPFYANKVICLLEWLIINFKVQIMNNIDQTLYIEIVAYVRPLRRIRVSILQREFVLGYNQALRMMARMQQEGIVKYLHPEAYWKVLV